MCIIKAPTSSPSHTQAVAQTMAVAPQSLHHIVVQPVDLFHIGKFLGTAQDDLPGLEPTMIDEVGEAPFALVRKKAADALPHLLLIQGADLFLERFCRTARLGQGHFSGSLTQMETHGIHDEAIEGRTYIAQGRRQGRELDLLVMHGRPEAGEGLGYIVLFGIMLQSHIPVGMALQPAANGLTETFLQACPGLIRLSVESVTEKLQVEALIQAALAALVLESQSILLNQCHQVR